jgi:transcriptional/translational regulatory protein YebC/TACO1
LWAFEKTTSDPAGSGTSFNPKHTLEISKQDQEKLKTLFEEMDDLEDIQDITTNCLIEL